MPIKEMITAAIEDQKNQNVTPRKTLLLLALAGGLLTLAAGMLSAPFIGGIALIKLGTTAAATWLGAGAIAAGAFSIANVGGMIAQTIKSIIKSGGDDKKAESLIADTVKARSTPLFMLAGTASSAVTLAAGVTLLGLTGPLGWFGTLVVGGSAAYMSVSGALSTLLSGSRLVKEVKNKLLPAKAEKEEKAAEVAAPAATPAAPALAVTAKPDFASAAANTNEAPAEVKPVDTPKPPKAA